MKHLKRSLSVLAVALLPAVAFTAVFTGAESTAEAKDGDRADCRSVQFFASRDGDQGVPDKLGFLKPTLEEDAFAIYKTFLFVEDHTLKLRLGKGTKEAKFKSGHSLALSLLGADGSKLKLHLDLKGRDGEKPLGNADVKMEDDSVFIVAAGPHTEGELKGKLFFAMHCKWRKKK